MANILEKIDKAALKFLEPLTPEETYRIIVDEIRKLVDAEHGAVTLEQQGELRRVYASFPTGPVVARKNGFTARAVREKEILFIKTSDVIAIRPDLKYDGVKHVIMVPLTYRNKSIGVLNLYFKK